MTRKIPKSYVYISDTKVDTLLGGIPESMLKDIAMTLEIDLKILKTSFSRSVPAKPEDRIQRLEAVVSYLEENGGYGSLHDPRLYLHDYLNMKSSMLTSSVYFLASETESTIVAFTGSVRHVVGNPGDGAVSASYTHSILSVLKKDGEETRTQEKNGVPTKKDDDSLFRVEDAVQQMTGPFESFEFVARRLLYGPGTMKKVLLATPLYIAAT
jgi:hypothetical protein